MQSDPATALDKSKIQEDLKTKPRIKLDFLNAFGVYTGTGSQQHDLHGCLAFVEETDASKLVLAYPVGRHVGVKDLRSNEMKFIR